MNAAHPTSDPHDLRQLPPMMALRAFERAAMRLSFKLAAQELALTPSAVSHQVRGLERHFGVRLFARTGRAVRLTPAGEQYLGVVGAALATLERAGRALRPASDGARALRISALPYFISSVMLPRLAELTGQLAGVTLHIDATHDYADFEATGVDLAVRAGRERTAGLHVDKLIDVRALPVCAPALLRGRSGLKSVDDLARHTLIHSSRQPRRWPAWLQDAGVPGLRAAGELWFDNVSLALEAAERGLGVALAMDPLVRSTPAFGSRLVAPWPEPRQAALTYYAVCRPEQKDSRDLATVRRWLRASCRALRPA